MAMWQLALRVWITERIYAAGELRLGREPHLRATGGIGVRWRQRRGISAAAGRDGSG